MQNVEMVPYQKATAIAQAYQSGTTRIRDLLGELAVEVDKVKDAFRFESTFGSYFDLDLRYESETYNLDEKGIGIVLREMKRHAWAVLVRKLDIMKLMSAKRQEELKEALFYSRGHNKAAVDALPDIAPETIMAVLSGYIESAHEFLEEKIREEYRWLVPCSANHELVTNQLDRVGRKVIKHFCVHRNYDGGFTTNYHNETHLSAIDSVFFALDGKGIPKEHGGQLVSAIKSSGKDGVGETDYFRFKCYRNNNLHLEFKRLDLLARFNEIAVGDDSRNVGVKRGKGAKA